MGATRAVDKHKIKKFKINKKGRCLTKDGVEVPKGDEIEVPLEPFMIEADDMPTLVCIKYPLTNTYKRIEILPVYLGPTNTEFDYRIVYEPDMEHARQVIAEGKSPFDGLTCEKVWSISEKDFPDYKFGDNTPTGGGEGGGTVGGPS